MSDLPHSQSYMKNNFMTVSHEPSNNFDQKNDYDLVDDEAIDITHPAFNKTRTNDHLQDRLSHLKTKLHN